MKKIFLFSFLLIIIVPIIYAYMPGEKIADTSTYPDISDVTYPCVIRNNSIYLSGDAEIKEYDCTITYYNGYIEIISSSGGGSSSSSSGGRRVNHTTTSSSNTSTPRLQTIPKTNNTQPPSKPTPTPPQPTPSPTPTPEPTPAPDNTATPEPLNLKWVLGIGFAILAVFGIGIFLIIKKLGKDDEEKK